MFTFLVIVHMTTRIEFQIILISFQYTNPITHQIIYIVTPSDEYFGFLDSNEGIWDETVDGDHDLEVGIGRI